MVRCDQVGLKPSMREELRERAIEKETKFAKEIS